MCGKALASGEIRVNEGRRRTGSCLFDRGCTCWNGRILEHVDIYHIPAISKGLYIPWTLISLHQDEDSTRIRINYSRSCSSRHWMFLYEMYPGPFSIGSDV